MASITCRNYIATDAKFATLAAYHCTLLHARRDEVLKLFSSPRDKSHCAIVNDFCGGRVHWVFPEVFFWPNGLNYGLKCPKRYPEYLLRGFCAKEARPKWRPAPRWLVQMSQQNPFLH